MLCETCGKKIPKERLEALPSTKTCVKCSNLDNVIGITVWQDGVPELIIMDENDAKNLPRQHDADISHL
jgi:hypothetical protein